MKILLLVLIVAGVAPAQAITCRGLFEVEAILPPDSIESYEAIRSEALKNELLVMGFGKFEGTQELLMEALPGLTSLEGSGLVFTRGLEAMRAVVQVETVIFLSRKPRMSPSWATRSNYERRLSVANDQIESLLRGSKATLETEAEILNAVPILIKLGEATPLEKPLTTEEMNSLIGVLESGLKRTWALEYWRTVRDVCLTRLDQLPLQPSRRHRH